MSSSQQPAKRRRFKLDLACQPLSISKSPLMDAPAEVRARIFEFLFKGTRISIENLTERKSSTPSAFKVSAPKATHRRCGILLACKSRHLEAQHVLARVRMTFDPTFAEDSRLKLFRDVYFPRLQRLRLPTPYSVQGFNSSMFPCLKWLECPNTLTDLNMTDNCGEELFEEEDLFALASHVVNGESDQKRVKEWMDSCNRGIDQVAAGDIPDTWLRPEDQEDMVRAFQNWRQLIDSTERKFQITTKEDFEIFLSHTVCAGGLCMCLVLVTLIIS